MQARPSSKYHLKDLHREIDLFDRKIAYCRNYEKFTSEFERESACHKLVTKRESLVKRAAAMTSQGIEYDPKQLPRSMKDVAVSGKANA
jgi:hypothetical protein